ncbi:MAG: VWA domain-containing protein, partial [Clostridia bacterium]|nr:VWA domain-containing protein [Clostridia bacterium]
LVTDGKETDEEAKQVIRGISSQGLSVDVAYVPSDYSGNDTQIIGITLPEYHVGVGDECDISVTIESKEAQEFYVALADNGIVDQTKMQWVSMKRGLHTETFKHVFKEDGLHEIAFIIAPVNEEEDCLKQNNQYCTYYYLETFEKVLIVERAAGDSETLQAMLSADSETSYDVTSICITDENFPKDVNALRAYDQVILNNISNAVMPEGFDQILSDYVKEFGGGLFTVGGESNDGKANAYIPDDMYGTLYQEMLPVQAINYTPPIGVMLIIDASYSMVDTTDDKGNILFDGAKAGAIACLDALTERDYIGVITTGEVVESVLPLTARTQERRIKAAIDDIEEPKPDTSTIFSGAFKAAGVELNVYKDSLAKRHVILVTDGKPNDPPEDYQKAIKDLAAMGITVSIIGIGQAGDTDMETAAALGNGEFYSVNSVKNLVETMKADLSSPRIKDVNDEEFNPTIYDLASPVIKDLDTDENGKRLTVELGGFYGSKIKADADLILTGNYNVPLYAQWKYGKGTVGSFMCDLQGSKWTNKFVADKNGQKLICNVVNNLMPTENIRPRSININLKEDNYTNTLSVFADLSQGEKIVGEIMYKTETGNVTVPLDKVTDLSGVTSLPACYVTAALSAENNYTRCGFIVKAAGVYTIVLKKVDANGNTLGDGEEIFYKSFSYSEEYDSIVEETEEDIYARLSDLAAKGNGKLVEDLEDPYSIFTEFVKTIDKVYDPRFLFMILAIVLFLADIAVRKFKFKWLHEIIRERKRNK